MDTNGRYMFHIAVSNTGTVYRKILFKRSVHSDKKFTGQHLWQIAFSIFLFIHYFSDNCSH